MNSQLAPPTVPSFEEVSSPLSLGATYQEAFGSGRPCAKPPAAHGQRQVSRGKPGCQAKIALHPRLFGRRCTRP